MTLFLGVETEAQGDHYFSGDNRAYRVLLLPHHDVALGAKPENSRENKI